MAEQYAAIVMTYPPEQQYTSSNAQNQHPLTAAPESTNFPNYPAQFEVPMECKDEPYKRESRKSVTRAPTTLEAVNTNIQEIITFSLLLFLELYKVTLACLFVVFVPQLCPPDKNTLDYPHVCLLEDNFIGLTRINTVALAFNFISLGLMLMHYFLVWKREKFLIEYLDEDPNLPESYLETVLPKYPVVEVWFHAYNRMIFVSSATNLFVSLINIALSVIICFRDYYLDYKTVTVFLTNLTILFSIMWASGNASVQGLDIKKPKGLSCIQIEPLQFNTIDKLHEKDVETRPEKYPAFFKLLLLGDGVGRVAQQA